MMKAVFTHLKAQEASRIILAKVLAEYRFTHCQIGDSDLDREQPRPLTISFTLGELRNLATWAQTLGLDK